MSDKYIENKDIRVSVAPMMDWTDRHCRYFHRLLAPKARLFTEMVTAQAVLHGDRRRLLGFDPTEHPVALQLGGSDPALMAKAAAIGADFGYDEINMNVGCPSDRVQEGRFGACLFAEPELVADCVAAMKASAPIPVTVKTRLAIDEMDVEEPLNRFIDIVADAGCLEFTIHARKAWLSGLSPKENRTVPPLNYDRVYRLKQRRPDLTITINGGIEDLAAVETHLEHVDGVMLGRAAYQNPFILAELSSALTGAPLADRFKVVEAMVTYADRQIAGGVRLHSIARHMHGLFQGQPGARAWRRALAENGPKQGATAAVLKGALTVLAQIQSTFAEKAA